MSPDRQFLSLTIRPLYDIFIDEAFQNVVIKYITEELIQQQKVGLYLISWEHGDKGEEPNHFQIAINSNTNLRSDNIKTALLSRLSAVGIDLIQNKVWFKCKVHSQPEGLIGYCWKEKPEKYLTNFPEQYLNDCVEKYKELSTGKVVATSVHVDNLIENIEKYCKIMEWSFSKVDPWEVLCEFVEQGRLSFATFKKIKREDLEYFWQIKHCKRK